MLTVNKPISAWVFAAIVTVALSATLWLLRAMARPNPQEMLTRARSAFARGDRPRATQIVDQLLSDNPNYGDANLLRCDLALAEGDLDAARRALARVADRPAPIGAQARFREGTIFVQSGRATKAEQCFLKSLSLDPAATPVELSLRELYMLQLRREDFRDLLRTRRTRRAWQLPDLLDFIVVGHVPRFLVGNWSERVTVLVQADPTDLHSQLALALYHDAMGHHERAAEIARTILLNTPGDAKATAVLVEALLNLDQVKEAELTLDDVQPQMARHPWILRSRGHIAFLSQQYPRAAAELEDSLKLEPGNPSALYQLGLCLQRTGAIDEGADHARCGQELANLVDLAQQILKQAQTSLDPHALTKQLFSLAELLAQCDLWEDSLYCCEFILQLEPHNNRALKLHAMATQNFQGHEKADDLRTTNTAPDRSADSRSQNVSHPQATSNGTVLQFEEVASKRGLAFVYFTGSTGNKYLFETLGGGCSAFDFDGDGWTDCYFAQGSRFPADATDVSYRDQLFRNLQGRQFHDVTDLSGLGDPNYTIGSSAADFNNDGFSDLFIANYGRNRAYRNNGDGTFTDVSSELGVDVRGMNTSLALADLDRDGDLDLYVVNYLASIDVCRDRQGAVFACHPSMFEAEQDVLFENLGDGRFLDVTEHSGVKVPNGKGLGIVIADLDNDAWPDIYVANDTAPNFLFRNLNPFDSNEPGSRLKFAECGLLAGAALSRDAKARAGMGIACADFDGNGYLDLYVTNYYLETNALFLNQSGMMFVDSVRPAILVADTTPFLGFGTQPCDADLDGNIDLFVANGHVDDYTKQDRNVLWKMPPKLYRNHGQLEFKDVSASAGPFFHGNYIGRGVARLDWNRDGRPDLIVVNQNEPAALLENITKTPCHRAIIELVGTASNRDAINTRCTVHVGERRQITEISSGDGYLVSNERRQIIGLGDQTIIDELEVVWPSGGHDRFHSLPADHHIVIIEGRQPALTPISTDPTRDP